MHLDSRLVWERQPPGGSSRDLRRAYDWPGCGLGLLLLAGILALLYRLNRNRNQLQLTQFSSAAWPITRATHRPVFQPPGTPAPEFVHDLKFPQKAMYHI
ncbi:hypothetical protein PGTUg99_017764 [Puccinia graminis f. sp. tritici]|uniref:Uncharacterized protein n=1 Tax=Puccinia graminis f. sp. tritici TaxID=56615 RepID=A0A5B0SBL1_PUCGR|nr:hypothetical protein PGTUg99_017764 [Puccinia graminis f. sp. tritici]